jgi:hypothetical protein
MEVGVILLFFLGVAAVIAIRLGAGSLDKDRIADYIRERGGRVISIDWAPFGKGWFGDKNDRIYEVVYYDGEGNQHFAACKTSLFSGVYWTDDRITHRKTAWVSGLPNENRPGNPLIRAIPETSDEDFASEHDRLKEENARLKEELRRLKGEE